MTNRGFESGGYPHAGEVDSTEEVWSEGEVPAVEAEPEVTEVLTDDKTDVGATTSDTAVRGYVTRYTQTNYVPGGKRVETFNPRGDVL